VEILILLIPISFFLMLGAGYAFFWAVNNNQFDDLEQQGLHLDDHDKVIDTAAPEHPLESIKEH
tara:strand:- start:2602 stop:2793 length:192 start_codon:yes stop_codon:yes gene_type:complete